MPAGTGVWVVKSTPARTASTASAKLSPSSTMQPADALEAEEAGVALVGVEHLGVDAERLERPHAADAEEDLLAQPVLGVAAVEPVGDLAHVVGVVLDVGVEQVERDAADVGPPHLGVSGWPARSTVDPHARRSGVSAMRVGVEVGVALLLPAVGVERLAEVAVPVEEADADEGHAEVAGRLQVVAGQHAEAAGVLRERLGDAELGGEVGDRAQRARAVAGLEPAGLRRGSGCSSVVHLVEEAEEAGVGGQRVEPLAASPSPSRRTGSWMRRVPPVGVDPAEQVAGLLVPAPAQVHGQRLEGGQLGGERRADREAAERAHPLDGSHGAIIGRTADRTSLKAEIGAIGRAWRARSRQFRWGRGSNGRWWMTSAPPVGASRRPTTTRSGHRREAPDASVDHVIAALDRGEGRDGPPEGDRPLFLPVGTTALPPNLDRALRCCWRTAPTSARSTSCRPTCRRACTCSWTASGATLLAVHPPTCWRPDDLRGVGLGAPAPRRPVGRELGPRRPRRRRDHRRLVAGPGRPPAAPPQPAPRPEPRRRGAAEPVLRLEPVLPEPAVPAHRRRPRGRAGRAGRPRRCRDGPSTRTGTSTGRRCGRSSARRSSASGPRPAATRSEPSDDPVLDAFAAFTTALEVHGGPWTAWPEDLRHPAGPGWADLVARHGRPGRVPPVGPAARRRAARGGPGDDPAGARPGHRHRPRRASTPGTGRTCSSSTAPGSGAPPDQFNTIGQDWGLPPVDPWRLRAAGYEPFVRMLRIGARPRLRPAHRPRDGPVPPVLDPAGRRRPPPGCTSASRPTSCSPSSPSRASGRRGSSSARTSAPSSRGCGRCWPSAGCSPTG